ncbi:hypothetical protein LSTR_LSTR014500 [Laodelphax striatellus]|uniref:Uncharacterized protein n=1 Tax=Laodelphax striatellus TaxID=195883 RepID=A0A482XAQ6_LAOST|nr:hypothetical protein LSTR_LSTR014500 [Laodelphax striatellus]
MRNTTALKKEEQILRKYTADQNRTKIRSHFDANSKSPSILLASPSGSAAASLLQYKDYIDSSRPQVADRSYSILRKPPMSQRRWVDCSNQGCSCVRRFDSMAGVLAGSAHVYAAGYTV